MLEQRINDLLGDEDPCGFGTGWWSGVVSAMLRRKKALALAGILFALGASLIGGASVPINQDLHGGPAIGLDWILLDLLLMTLIFSPIEVLWPAYPEQSVFRSQWLTDIVYLLSTHLPIRITTFLILLPATRLSAVLNVPALTDAVGHLPWIVQFVLAVVIADFAEYAIHRAFHEVPSLWRFHAIHHSSTSLDWIAGSRSHIVDDIAVRAFSLISMMCIFSRDMLVAYLFFVNIHATWARCNFGPTVGWLEPYLVQPRFHHWHHTSQLRQLGGPGTTLRQGPRQLHKGLREAFPDLTLEETRRAVRSGYDALESFGRRLRGLARTTLAHCAAADKPCILVLAPLITGIRASDTRSKSISSPMAIQFCRRSICPRTRTCSDGCFRFSVDRIVHRGSPDE